jgi:protoporphyrinogen/coproporphyrinogen III oxidase
LEFMHFAFTFNFQLFTNMTKLIIIGGGIAGLAAAWYAQKANIPYTLLESSNRFGGLIHTERFNDCIIEYGPDAFISRKPWALNLAKELGLEPIPVNKTPQRIYVLLKKRLVPLPDGLGLIVPTKLLPFLRSPLLSWYGKLRLLAEQFIPASTISEDESLASFITRRMGKEALHNLAEPLLAGVYNAEMEKQSILATFPQYRALEKQHGSLIRGMRASQKSASEDSGLLSFNGGMGELIESLVSQLTGDLRLYTSASSIDCRDSIYAVRLSNNEIIESTALILATPAHISATLLESFLPQAAKLREIRYAGIGSISLAYRVEDVPRQLDAYGVVIPGNQGRPIDGMQWNSSKWPGRAPDGTALIRIFFGGANSRFMLEKPETEILEIVRGELREILGIRAAALFYRIGKWENAYPQYELGHREQVATIESALPSSIALAGNAYRGVGIPDSINSAIEAVRKISVL